MRLVAIATRRWNREHTLVDAFGLLTTLSSDRSRLLSCRRDKGFFRDFGAQVSEARVSIGRYQPPPAAFEP
jgi:hypothetical protein